MNEALWIILIAMLTVAILAVVRYWLREVRRFDDEEAKNELLR